MKLSQSATSLWAKTSPVQMLHEHMFCSSENAKKIWRYWVSVGVKDMFSQTCDSAEHLFVFLASAHDLGKATPAFQLNPRISSQLQENVLHAGLPSPKRTLSESDRKRAKHALATLAILEKMGVDKTVSVVDGGHHGKPPSRDEVGRSYILGLKSAFGFNSEPWETVQRELFEYALELSNTDKSSICAIKLTIPQQMILTGLVILTDWISSSTENVMLPDRWESPYDFQYEDIFQHHFKFKNNEMQALVIEKAKQIQQAGIFIIEAPMGCGKTEAALALAEIFSVQSKRSGVYFALPSRATADGIFERYHNWIKIVSDEEPHALVLAHGKANRNQLYNELRHIDINSMDGDTVPSVFVHEWLSGRKLQMLADFGVGTIDQLLMGALRHKFIALRHLGLANKVMIIDEVHAYDAYMDSYLFRILQWLSAYHVPVIVLSATLPAIIRKKLIMAYVPEINKDSSSCGWEESQEYPLITFSDGNVVKQCVVPQRQQPKKTVQIQRFDVDGSNVYDEYIEIGNRLDEYLQNGGCAGIIVNTVNRAQKLAEYLSSRFGTETIWLLHSRFIAIDRAERERKLLDMVGKNGTRPHKYIVIGTQVMEQSLDIDFDILFTDCCPMDLLLQRIGRLHRHERIRPQKLQSPLCLVMQVNEFDKGSVAVYGAYPLLCTQYLLPSIIVIPDDIATLVQKAYGDDILVPENKKVEWQCAKDEQDAKIAKKEKMAETFQLTSPFGFATSLIGWLDFSDKTSETQGEASVRDSDAAIEVLLIQKVGMKLQLLPWVSDGSGVPVDRIPDGEIAYALSGCSLSLPYYFSAEWAQLKTINALELIKEQEIPSIWDDCHWLRGALYLVLNENLQTELCGKILSYHYHYGLMEGDEAFESSI